MTQRITRRRFSHLGLVAAGAVWSTTSLPNLASAQRVRQASGIVSVTRGPADVSRPQSIPPGKTWRYGLILPFQIAPRKAAAFVNLRIRNGVLAPEPVADRLFGDYEVGVDLIPFDDISNVRAETAIVLSRNHAAPNPNANPPGTRALMVVYPERGGSSAVGRGFAESWGEARS